METVLERQIAGQRVIVRSHYKMHLDEIVALWLIEKFAGPGWVRRYSRRGVVNLGVNGGQFDEHRSGEGASLTACCATLVAESLRVSCRHELRQLLKFISAADALGQASPFDWYTAVKLLNQRYPGDQEKVIAWAFEALEAHYEQQLDFKRSRDLIMAAPFRRLLASDGRKLRLVLIESDGQTLMKAAAFLYGEHLAALIQRKSNGQTLVLANSKRARPPISLAEAVWRIRLAELGKKGKTVQLTDLRSRQAAAALRLTTAAPSRGPDS